MQIQRLDFEDYHILIANSADYLPTQSLAELVNKLPVQFHKKAFRYRKATDAFNYVMGRLMILEALEGFGLPLSNLEGVRFSETGQPIIDGLNFNISHSGIYVVCAVAKEEAIGIDIEVIRPVKLEHLKKPFTDKEWKQIQDHQDQSSCLLDLWTKKEAVLKLYGAGIGAVEKVDLKEDGKTAVFDKRYFCELHSFLLEKNIQCCVARNRK